MGVAGGGVSSQFIHKDLFRTPQGPNIYLTASSTTEPRQSLTRAPRQQLSLGLATLPAPHWWIPPCYTHNPWLFSKSHLDQASNLDHPAFPQE